MKQVLHIVIAAVAVLALAAPTMAAPLRVFVSDISVVGVQNKDEMKATLQMLLASRIAGNTVSAVGSVAEADAVVTGTYVVIGKVFSVDAVIKAIGGAGTARAFVQGDGQDELIPAIGTLAAKLSVELARLFPTGGAPVAAAPAAVAVPVVPRGDEIIRPKDTRQDGAAGGVGRRLEGVYNLMALGASRPDGSRELYLAEDRRIACFNLVGEMKIAAEAELGITEKIISIDTFGQDLFVTIVRSDELSSQVWQRQGDKLVRVARDLPWFFRSTGLAGGAKKLYAQAMGRDADFYGDVFEAERNGSTIVTKNPISMPRYGSIYSFNQVKVADGALLTVVINHDNYLVVYDQKQKELWRSNEKFGGSELSFQKEDLDNVRTTGSKYRTVYLNQKVQATGRGELLVGRNEGAWLAGYKKGAVYALVWNGSSLEEKWRTKDTPSYMPDYVLDEGRSELLLLQLVQKPAMFGGDRGATALMIRKVE